jgi:inosine-uridine nucleoside N-ribohydrolase
MFWVHAQSKAVPVIFDTDMGPDYDDVGAIAMLHAFADNGEAEILATMASTKYEGVASVLDVLNTYFQKPDIPIGVPKGNALLLKDFQHWTDTLIAKYPHSLKSNKEAPDVVRLYRKILSRQPDTSVTLITVGFLTNIAAVLRSLPDDISPMTGEELLHRKVKRMVSMAGKFPKGLEFNIEEDSNSAIFAFNRLKVPIVFSGFEIGDKILTGLPLVNDKKVQHSPIKDVYSISIPKAESDRNGRMSWDQTAVLVAVKGYSPFFKVKSGTIVVNKDGSNVWDDGGSGHHHLITIRPHEEVRTYIDSLMRHQPRIFKN